MLNKEEIATWFKSLQDDICQALETADGKGKFEEELWERPGGGGGRTRILQQGSVIEKGGVNFSAVHGELPDVITKALQVDDNRFFATGVSIVMHPHSPMVPIIHMNVRFFQLEDGTEWFGGGIDLTPHYVIAEDAQFFHKQLKTSCDKHNPEYYTKFKKWADDYFFIKHRDETRGIGGIFYDRLAATPEMSIEKQWAFTQEIGKTFASTYVELMKRNKDKAFTEAQKEWQYIRRSRYVEFNLVYDKGTKFGLDTDGRTESILMSMPPTAKWHYNHAPQINSEEAYTLSKLKKGIDWA